MLQKFVTKKTQLLYRYNFLPEYQHLKIVMSENNFYIFRLYFDVFKQFKAWKTLEMKNPSSLIMIIEIIKIWIFSLRIGEVTMFGNWCHSMKKREKLSRKTLNVLFPMTAVKKFENSWRKLRNTIIIPNTGEQVKCRKNRFVVYWIFLPKLYF